MISVCVNLFRRFQFEDHPTVRTIQVSAAACRHILAQQTGRRLPRYGILWAVDHRHAAKDNFALPIYMAFACHFSAEISPSPRQRLDHAAAAD